MTVLVLDCDGVVLTGHPGGGRWDQHIARDFGLTPERLQAHFFQPHWPSIGTGRADLFEVLERVWPQLECRGDAKSFVDYWFANDSAMDERVLAQVDAWRAAGRKAYLGTTQEHHRARYLWQTLGLKTRFDGMLYSAELGAKKPDAAFYAAAQARLPVRDASEVIFLDDLIGNVEAARAHGWRAHHFQTTEDLRAALSQFHHGRA